MKVIVQYPHLVYLSSCLKKMMQSSKGAKETVTTTPTALVI